MLAASASGHALSLAAVMILDGTIVSSVLVEPQVLAA